MGDKSNRQSEIKKGLLKVIFMTLGAGIVDVIAWVVTGKASRFTFIGIGIGAALAFLTSINKRK